MKTRKNYLSGPTIKSFYLPFREESTKNVTIRVRGGGGGGGGVETIRQKLLKKK